MLMINNKIGFMNFRSCSKATVLRLNPDQERGVPSRDFASITVAPMSVEPGRDCTATTFRLPKSSEDSRTAAEIAADPWEIFGIPEILASKNVI